MPDPVDDPFKMNPDLASGSLLQTLLPILVVDVVLPIVLFNVLLGAGVPVLWALIASGLPPALNNLRTWIKARRLEPLGIIVIAFLVVGSATSLISGDIFFALIKDSFLTGTFGLLCLGSLLTARPLFFLINRQFVAGEDAARIAWWNGLWQYPSFRHAMRIVTAVWGITYVAEALVRVGLALVLTPSQVVTLSPVLGFGALVALIVWNRRYMMAFRAERQRLELLKSAG